MVSLQGIIMYVFLPPAALLLLLLIVPAPVSLKRLVVKLVQAVFDAHLPQYPNFKFVWGVILVLLISFISCTVSMLRDGEKVQYQKSEWGHAELPLVAHKWRNERNWWIALYALSLYAFLYLYNATLRSSLLQQSARAREAATHQHSQ